MPRDGSLTLSDIREPTLTIVCERCGRHGRYNVARLGARLDATVGSFRRGRPKGGAGASLGALADVGRIVEKLAGHARAEKPAGGLPSRQGRRLLPRRRIFRPFVG